MRVAWLWLGLAVSSLGCGAEEADSCYHGPLTSSAHVAQGLGTNGSAHVRVIWSPGPGAAADLSDAYFRQAALSTDATADVRAQVASIALTATRDLTITFDTGATLAGATLTVPISFPDLRSETACHHPGMADEFVMTVVLVFASDGTLASSSVTESYRLGAI